MNSNTLNTKLPWHYTLMLSVFNRTSALLKLLISTEETHSDDDLFTIKSFLCGVKLSSGSWIKCACFCLMENRKWKLRCILKGWMYGTVWCWEHTRKQSFMSGWLLLWWIKGVNRRKSFKRWHLSPPFYALNKEEIFHLELIWWRWILKEMVEGFLFWGWHMQYKGYITYQASKNKLMQIHGYCCIGYLCLWDEVLISLLSWTVTRAPSWINILRIQAGAQMTYFYSFTTFSYHCVANEWHIFLYCRYKVYDLLHTDFFLFFGEKLCIFYSLMTIAAGQIRCMPLLPSTRAHISIHAAESCSF